MSNSIVPGKTVKHPMEVFTKAIVREVFPSEHGNSHDAVLLELPDGQTFLTVAHKCQPVHSIFDYQAIFTVRECDDHYHLLYLVRENNVWTERGVSSAVPEWDDVININHHITGVMDEVMTAELHDELTEVIHPKICWTMWNITNAGLDLSTIISRLAQL